MTLDAKAMEAATPLFKEFGLTNDQVQKLMDIQVQSQKDLADRAMDAVKTMRAEWVAQVKADPEIGGTKIDGVLAEINKAKALLPEKVRAEFNDAMSLTGAGDHPAFVKAFYTLAKMVNEGHSVPGKGPSPNGQTPSGQPERKSLAASMYPSLPSG